MKLPLLIAILSWAALAQAAETAVKVVASPPARGANRYYAGNREPLLPNPLIKLPTGSVRPQGYLRRQMELMAEGFTGRLAEISKFCRIEDNAWVARDGSGHSGWEEVPYWLRGYWNLGYLLNDERILNEANRWLDGVLATQRPSGYFGSDTNLIGERTRGVPDLWPNMVMLFPLRARYEATGDQRILDFMLRYFRWQTTIPLEKLIPSSWQHWRAGDNLDTIYWLYNRTGAAWLLELARANHERTADWVGSIPTWHVVNIAQCFREPGQYYQQSRDIRYLHATERVYDTIRGIYGQVPGGMYGADENARPGFDGPRQATETCAFVEMMFSGEMLAGITGDVKWADRVEEVAFNSFPPSMTPDLKGLHYLTAPNQVQLDRVNKSPMVQNGGDMFSYNPHQYRCCQHNVAFGWPYFTEYQWMATRDQGLAAVLYGPGEVTAKAGDGTTVKITETTDYPFDEVVNFTISTPKPVRFPLALRVPGWCQEPVLSVNGERLAVPKAGKGWAVVERVWDEGAKVRLELPARITLTEWTRNRNTVSVNRGPLTYSLRIGERWQKKEGTAKWPGFEVYPTTPWNYGLIADRSNPASSFEVVRTPGRLAPQPFTVDGSPILLRAKAKRIPQWKQEPNGMVGEVQPGPVRSDQPAETITLIPMGCARLRISAFPRVSDGPDAQVWQETTPIFLASGAGHFDPPSAVGDGILPRNSADRSIPRFLWPEPSGGPQWIELMYSAQRRIRGVEVYWAEDGTVRLPAAWRLLYWDGASFQPVSGISEYELLKNGFSRARFDPVESTRLRLEVQLRERSTAGILEWRVH